MAPMSAEQRRRLLEKEVRDLTKDIREMGRWVQGSMGQMVLNPALAARRQALEAIRKLEASTPADDGPDPLAEFDREHN